jgi:outer membrane protein OmpA-like peptidoglycan-associated protein
MRNFARQEEENMASLLESLRSYITPDIVNKAGSFLGESSGGTQKALDGIFPTLLGGVANMASTSAGATQLTGLLQRGGYDGSILNNLGSLLSDRAQSQNLISSGQGLLGSLLGDKAPAMASAIGSYGGISSSSASSLMALAAPLIMSLLGKTQVTEGLSWSGLASLLTSQKASILSAIPAGLARLPSISGWLGGTPTAVTSAASAALAETSGMGKRLLPMLLLVMLAIALLAYWKGCGSLVKHGLANLTLPGGAVISVPEGSLDYNLARFLADGNSAELPKTFVFDNLNFYTGSTQLTPESQPTVTNLIAILKAYPNTEVQLVGHTDNSGDPAANMKLSQDRANAVRDMLVDGGIDANRISTAGYGQDKPIASNDTGEGRAKNRRTELVVTKK